MSFRTVVVRNRAKLDFQLNYLVCRGEAENRIHLSEITCLIVESTAVSLTAALLCELVKRKVKVIFCDEKHNPHSELTGLHDNYHSSKSILLQTKWSDEIKRAVWTDIVFHKIGNQASVLKKCGKARYKDLLDYRDELEYGDATNREGHAAKVYFKELFESDRRTKNNTNDALNYGYAILLSAFNREVTAAGYITQLGIWHCNEFNPHNLSCDLMESFRPIVDEAVYSLKSDDKEFKTKLINLLNCRVEISGKKLFLSDAIAVYVRSVTDALNSGDVTKIQNFTCYELPIYETDSDV